MKRLLILFVLFAVPVFAQNFDFPSNPTNGQQVTGPAGQIMEWDGTKWIAMLGGGGGGAGQGVIISATAPPAPVSGTLWFDTTTVQMFVWYTSGTTSQWAPVSHP